MDRKVKTLGFRRGLEETLHAFADRIRRGGSPLTVPSSPVASVNGQLSTDKGQRPTENRVAEWYLQYADLRYGRASGPRHIEQLRQFVREL
jgi:hypothetical protein